MLLEPASAKIIFECSVSNASAVHLIPSLGGVNNVVLLPHVGSATARAIAYRPRNADFYYYPGKSAWTELFVGGSYDFVRNGARYLDARTAFFYTATGVGTQPAHGLAYLTETTASEGASAAESDDNSVRARAIT